MKTVLCIVGTRPEAIKMAPLILGLADSRLLRPRVCSTGQHREMLDQAFADFGITPDLDLRLMTRGQSLAALSGRLFHALDELLERERPWHLLVQGDTTTVMVAALCAFYRNIPVGHVEAGLRSGDLRRPFPEELNRRVATLAARLHFAPTPAAAEHLRREGVSPNCIHITGNTVVDALLHIRESIRRDPPPLPSEVENVLRAGAPCVLVTLHRRELGDAGIKQVCQALRVLAQRHADTFFVCPVHLNPHIREQIHARLGGIRNIPLIRPLGYREFIRLMDAALFVMSDSGGVQEEAPSLNKRVLVLREVTERPEAVEAGFCRLVGAREPSIIEAVENLLAGREAGYPSRPNPFGDGRAAARIIAVLEQAAHATAEGGSAAGRSASHL